MTEGEWLTCPDPRKMLEGLRDNSRYERKLRLFTVACCRRIWHLLDHWGHNAVEVAERFADTQSTQEDLGFWEREWEVLSRAWRSGVEDYRSCGVQAAGCAVGPGKAFRAAQHAMRLAQAALVTASGEMDVLPRSGRRARERWYRESWGVILRCVFGNPFRPVPLEPGWLTWNGGTVVQLAKGIYEERGFERMPILADALEEAGCGNAEILSHCRGPGPHVRGCWVVDSLLGNK